MAVPIQLPTCLEKDICTWLHLSKKSNADKQRTIKMAAELTGCLPFSSYEDNFVLHPWLWC
jgi:hypothetical protein